MCRNRLDYPFKKRCDNNYIQFTKLFTAIDFDTFGIHLNEQF